MAEDNKNTLNEDSFDINEWAKLSEDISPDFLDQLQNKVSQNAGDFMVKRNDGDLFEEIQSVDSETEPQEVMAQEFVNSEPAPNNQPKADYHPSPALEIDNIKDDDFTKKYKAKLNKHNQDSALHQEPVSKESAITVEDNSKNIENLTSGNIIEKPITDEQKTYNDSLDFLDENIKYSKYVIYIDPENVDFIESLTVKERKNLINKILREQDEVAIARKKVSSTKSMIKHSIIAILTIAISIPIVYSVVNAALEASINNYRASQSIFKTLYKENGKIQSTKRFH